MISFGMVRPGSTLYIPFNTFDSNDPSASVAIAAFVVGDIEIYKDGGTTQRASDTGVTLLDTDGIDFDAHVGIGGFSIDLSSNATAGFFAAGSRYFVVVGPTTVDAAVVNFVACTFEIGYPDAILNTTMATRASATSFTLANGSTDDDAYNGCPVIIHNIASAFDMVVGYVLDYTGSSKTITLQADPGVITSVATDHISILPQVNVGAWNNILLVTTNPLPNAAADAAGGIPISDAGGLDLDTQLAATNEVTAARMAALTDWINGGRLDLLLDAIPTTAMRGTDSAALASVATEARLAELDAANLPANVDSILTDTADSQPLIEKMAYVGSRGLGVWIDDGAANTNTVLGTDGTPDNPVSTIAAATTIATALGSQRFYLVNDTVITLAQIYEGYEFVGIGEMSANSVNFGTQDVDNSIFHNLLLTGAQAGTGRCQAEDCVLSVITGMEITALRCLLANAGSLTLRDDCAFDSCFSAVAGAATPTLNINSVASVNVYFRHYSGGMQVDNAVATTVMSFEADGQLIIDATCTSLTVVVRGNCSITDNGTTTSLTEDAAVTRTSINAEADTALSDYDGPTKAEMDTAHALLATPAQVATELGTYDSPTKAEMDTAHALLATPTQVNEQVVDVLKTDTITLPGQGAPPLTPTFEGAISWLYKVLRNRKTQTATQWSLMADDESTVDSKATVSDDATTGIKQEIVSGP